MKKIILVALMGVSLFACAEKTKLPETVQNVNDIAPYPEAKAGYTRFAINLPALPDENNARIELLIGKEMNVDCNSQRLAGTVKEEELKGWGYSYYVVEAGNGVLSTMMACPAGSNKNQFVTLHHNLGWLDYNSRLPIVIYAPNDFQIKYRVWQPDAKILPAKAE
ncbi:MULTISPECIES: serine protease inhibitor ecotin [unclassified Gilliamella]|uniref:serine protease inhibitor ecotin n=1 Tax=unclassified Gilliamella TaxID=2685620 RepID=UPI00080E69B7|nr:MULTISPECIES: serine protease inhibitor ecotin [Gilliamella]MCX8574602.1 serine protease inhibitor ecotin [Gilliamella sp. B3831]MCX8576833.1 serine protease inhibitor ecotin [Gilliamella sp. B3815]MCX8578547.1 serine protease inhibitor ecotin [Gilliamella sp. B2717]MCX8589185.1 serine protease inhibitor ecotin [Gilliamella sp. B3812]MCX8603759.1 serine protease inhibitor ecotin [Gilliamella sp. B3823]